MMGFEPTPISVVKGALYPLSYIPRWIKLNELFCELLDEIYPCGKDDVVGGF